MTLHVRRSLATLDKGLAAGTSIPTGTQKCHYLMRCVKLTSLSSKFRQFIACLKPRGLARLTGG
jgi:hypothetical protein